MVSLTVLTMNVSTNDSLHVCTANHMNRIAILYICTANHMNRIAILYICTANHMNRIAILYNTRNSNSNLNLIDISTHTWHPYRPTPNVDQMVLQMVLVFP